MGVRVRQKTKGKGNPWWVFVTHNGRRTSRKVGDKKAAETVASTIRAKLQLGEFGFEEQKPVPTFKEYANIWLKTDLKANCKKSTAENYRGFLRRHILPEFGNLRVTDINKRTVKSFLLEKFNAGYSKSLCGQLKGVISGVLNVAVDDEAIPANPALQLGKGFLKEKDKKKTIDVLTSEELKQLLDTVERDFSEHYPFFLALSRTGMRIGEALGLKWQDLDFNSRTIEICRSYYRARITRPKNGKTRLVDMSLQLAETLKMHETNCKRKGLALGLGEAPEFVFTGPRGGLIDLSPWRKKVFHKAVRASGVKKIRIHDIRHTYASLRISKGDNVADVSKQLGHHSVKFTMDCYYHWFPGKKKSEVDGLDDAMHPNAPPAHPSTVNSL